MYLIHLMLMLRNSRKSWRISLLKWWFQISKKKYKPSNWEVSGGHWNLPRLKKTHFSTVPLVHPCIPSVFLPEIAGDFPKPKPRLLGWPRGRYNLSEPPSIWFLHSCSATWNLLDLLRGRSSDLWNPSRTKNAKKMGGKEMDVHPGRLTWNLTRHPRKRKIIFQTIIFRFYVNLRGCTWRIIPVGITPFRGLTIPMVINHLRYLGWSSKYFNPQSYLHVNPQSIL